MVDIMDKIFKKNSKNSNLEIRGWNFPSNNNGDIKGLQDAGEETFKGSIFKSLAREICQNSLDARYDKNKPVKIVFELMEAETSKVPGNIELATALRCCKEYCEPGKKGYKFFEKAENIIRSKYIRVLRIGDYNTTGIYGAEKKEYSPCPWHDLVRCTGVSNKGGDSGGSFGIGKSAPFVCSDLKTIFYSTLDKNGINAYQGIANLISFKYPYDREDLNIKAGEISQGKGYYGKVHNNSAILEKFEFNNYKRKEMGTDLFVFGFIDRTGWQEDIIKYVIEDYLISILNNQIEVEVDGEIINNKTIHEVIDRYKDDNSLVYNYYQVLTRDDVTEKTFDFNGLGEVELKILIEKDFNRRVLMARNTGMKIFDKKNISGTIPFAGVCILKGEKVNDYFKKMENPQHNKWEEDRHDNPKEAKKNKKALFSIIKEEVKKLGKETSLVETDAVGAGEYIPDLIENEAINNNAAAKENISNEIKEYSEIKIKPVKRSDLGANFEKSSSSDVTVPFDEPGTNSEDGDLVSGQPQTTDNKASGGVYNGNTGGTGYADSNGRTKVQKPHHVEKIKERIIFNPKKSEYKMVFEINNSAENVEVEFQALGEQGNIKINVKEAILNEKERLKINENGNIIIPFITGKQEYIIRYTLKNNEICCMGVKFLGNKI